MSEKEEIDFSAKCMRQSVLHRSFIRGEYNGSSLLGWLTNQITNGLFFSDQAIKNKFNMEAAEAYKILAQRTISLSIRKEMYENLSEYLSRSFKWNGPWYHGICLNLVKPNPPLLEKEMKNLLKLIVENDTNYQIREELVIQAFSCAKKLGYKVGIRHDARDGPEWPIFAIELPNTGEVSWHIKCQDLGYTNYSTEEKNNRCCSFANKNL